MAKVPLFFLCLFLHNRAAKVVSSGPIFVFIIFSCHCGKIPDIINLKEDMNWLSV